LAAPFDLTTFFTVAILHLILWLGCFYVDKVTVDIIILFSAMVSHCEEWKKMTRSATHTAQELGSHDNGYCIRKKMAHIVVQTESMLYTVHVLQYTKRYQLYTLT